MKHFKKIMAMVITLAMVLTMSMAAFADDAASDNTITITNAVAGHTYTAYQIFAGTKASKEATDNKLGNVTWGDGINDAGKAALATQYGVSVEDANAALKISEKVIPATATTDAAKDDAAVTFANTVGTNVVSAKGHTGTLSGTTYTISDLPAGYYMIVDSYTPDDGEVEGEDYTISRYMLQVVGDTTVVNKADKPTVDKKIDGTKDQDSTTTAKTTNNTTNIGDKVPYEITSKVPEMTGYQNYYFVLNDTMTEGLTFNDDVVIKVGNKTLTGTTITAETSDADATAARTSNGETFYVETSKDGTNTKIKIVFNNFVQYESLVGSDIVVTYSATLNEKAKVDETANKNEVELVYSNDPTKDGGGEPDTPDEPKPGEVTGKTPKTTTETYSTVLKIKKIDGDDSTKTLTGAKFKITATKKNSIALVNSEIFVEDAQGTYYMLKDGTYTETAPVTAKEGYTADKYDDTTKKYKKVTTVTKETVPDTQTFTAEGYVKADGTLTFTGLSEGEYVITELVAPEGYNLLTESTTVKIGYSYDEETSKITWEAPEKLSDNTDNPVEYVAADKAFEIDILNNKGAELPSTGGIGTTIFYVIGAILVIGAGVVLITRRRMDA